MKSVMLRYFIFWQLALLIPLGAHAQIAVPSTVCKDQQFYVNDSNGSGEITWDFCEGDLLLNPVPVQGSSNDFNVPVGTSLIRANGKWYGFICSLTNNSLFRLDFGSSLSNSSPQIVNLGNIGGLLSGPQDIEVLQFDGLYYAFVSNRSVNKLVRINLGGDIESTTATGNVILSGNGLTNAGLDVQFDGANWIVGITNATTLTLVNLGSSPGNDPASQTTLTTSAIPGITSIGDVKFVKEEDDWYAFVVGYSSKTLHRLDFGADLFVNPTATKLTDFQFAPYGLDMEQDNGRWIMFVATLQGNLLRLDFGPLLTNPSPDYANLGKLGALNNLLKIDMARESSRWFALTTNWDSKNYYIIEFPQAVCPFDKEVSSQAKEKLYAAIDGTFHISLYEEDSHGLLALYPLQIEVLNKQAPALDFSSSSVCEDVGAIFTPISNQTLTSVSWDFGLYGGSSDDNPVVNFASSGTYPVELQGLSENGCNNLVTRDIEIYPSLDGTANFTLPAGVLCTNNAFTFTTTTPDIYNGNLSYQWFVDNTLVSADRDLQYTFTTTGPKNVKLITSIPGCSAEITKTTSPIAAGPVVDFSFTGSCEDDTFSFQNQTTDPVTGYQWDFGNGETSAIANPNHTFTTYGNYSVSLTATNSAGCQNVKRETIVVHSKPQTDFSAAGPPNSCSGIATQFKDESSSPDGAEITAWLWDFHDANSPMPDNAKDATHTFATAGIYNVSLTATTAAGCEATTGEEISISPSPSTAFTFSSACVGLPVSFASPQDNSIINRYWEIGNAYYNSSTPTHTFASYGDYPLYLEVTSENGCISNVNKVIHVPAPLSPDFSALKNCVGQEAVLADVTSGTDPVVSRQWTFDTGETFSGSQVMHTFPEQGDRTITLSVTAESGCVYQASKEIEIVPSPTARFSADPATGAYPLEVRFVNTSSASTEYLWKFNDGSGATSTEASPLHTFNGIGSFTVELTALNEQECEDSFTAPVTTEEPLPDADIEQINFSQNEDGSLKLIVTLHNKGNTVLRNLPIELDFNGQLTLRQVLQEPIQPSSNFNYVFSTGIVDTYAVGYLCVSALVEKDVAPAGNRACQEFDNRFVVLDAFPNPTTGLLHLEWIEMGDQTVRVSLTDVLGRTLLALNVPGSDGLNRRTIDLSGLPNGIYNVLIEGQGMKKIQRITVSGKP